MADQKISALTPLTTAPTPEDQLIINHKGTGGFETQSISFKDLVSESAGVAATQYFDFDGGTNINITSFWGDFNGGNAYKVSDKTKKFTAPANSVGAYVYFTARMDSKVCNPATESIHYGNGSQPEHKLFAACVCTTPDAQWETIADDSNGNVTSNGFSMRLVTTMSVGSQEVGEDLYGTYHAAKWNYISYTKSDSDREMDFNVRWDLIRAGFQNVTCGMNRIIIIPLYESPVTNTSRTYVNPIPQMQSGSIPEEFSLRADQMDDYEAALNELAQTQSSKEVMDRTTIYSATLDKILRNIEVYIQNYPDETENIDELIDIRTDVYSTRLLNKLADAEKAIFDTDTGLFDRAKAIIGVPLQFEELPTTFTSF